MKRYVIVFKHSHTGKTFLIPLEAEDTVSFFNSLKKLADLNKEYYVEDYYGDLS